MNERSFQFEFHAQVPDPQDALRGEAERRLRDLAAGHTDMIGASVAIEQLVHAETPHVYEARVVAYTKPENVAANEKGDTAMTALKGVLDALERQVREVRDLRGEPWKKP